MTLSPSEKDVYLECRLKHHYAYVEKPGIRTVSSNLLRGTAGHAALESYYSSEPSGRSLDMLVANFRQALQEQVTTLGELASWEEDEVRSAAKNGELALQHFWKALGIDEQHSPVETEVRLARELVSGDATSEYHGVADGVWRPEGRVVVMEFKFPGDFYGMGHEYLYWNSQSRAYPWMLNTELPVYVEYTLCTPKKTERITTLVGKQAMAEEEHIASVVSWRKENDVVVPTYDWHCTRCTFNKLCLVRLTGGEA